MASLELKNLWKAFDAVPVLRGVSLSVREGEFLAVVGPSGCGKSTLLRILAGLEAQDAGEVLLGGARVDGLPPKARDVAMVFQSYALYPHMTVAENLALPLAMRDLTRFGRLPLAARLSRRVAETRRRIRETVRRTAALVELTELLERKPKQLSGGQRQRTALARALVRRPRLFLLDEPLSNLDAALRASMRSELVELQRQLGVTTVYVTHDQTEAMTMASRIAVMIGGELVQLGTPEEVYDRPADIRVARFIGTPAINLLDGRFEQGRLHLAGYGAIAGVRAGHRSESVTVGLRPEHLLLHEASGPGRLQAMVRHLENLGSEVLLHLAPERLPDRAPLILRAAPAVARLAPGTEVSVGIAPGGLHVFDGQGRRIALEAHEGQRTMAASAAGLAAVAP